MTALIDFAGVAAGADLRALVESALGSPEKIIGGKPHWLCPFHADQNPSFYLWDSDRRWWCWSCHERGGDAIDFLCRHDRITPLEAARQLDPHAGPLPVRSRAERSAPASRPVSPAAWEDAAWQDALDSIVNRAESNLWSPAGRPALDWLRWRGLEDHTIRRFRLGFLPDAWTGTAPLDVLGPDRHGKPRGLALPRGITFPWVRPGSWYSTTPDPDDAEPGPRWVGLNVRRLAANPFDALPGDASKTLCVKGSVRGNLYPNPDLAEGVPALICEGEIDALVGWQEAGIVANVGTVGGATQRPSPLALAALAVCPWWLLAFDHDEAGADGVRLWIQHGRSRALRLQLPAHDLDAHHMAGGRVLDWLMGEFGRLGLPWPPRRPS